MKNIYILFIMIIIGVLVFVTACNSSSSPKTENNTTVDAADNSEQSSETSINTTKSEDEQESPLDTVSSPISFEIESKLKNNYQYEFVDFNLLDGVYESKAGRSVPYKLRGIIGVPKGEGTFPVVLITHGSHNNEDENKRFDTGYEYLVKALAGNGYIAISMDMTMPYIWKYGDDDDMEKSVYLADEHIKSILLANEGEIDYKVDLKGKVDTDKIALIGHSRGGESIFPIAAQQQEKGIKIDTLIAVAPTWNLLHDWADVSAAILVPQYDGDVIRLDGFSIYELLKREKEGNHSVTLLMGANHNFFNSNIEKNDALSHEIQEENPQISREEQEMFLVNFVVDFLDTSFGKQDNFYHTSQLQPNKMYGFNVKRLVNIKDTIELIYSEDYGKLTSNTLTVKHVIDSWFYKLDDIAIDTITLGLDEYQCRDLISIEWNNVGSSIIISPRIGDFSNKVALSISLVYDSASELNLPYEPLSFSVLLKDTKGNQAKVVLPKGENILKPTPGKLDITELPDETVKWWSPPTPIGMLNIPLNLFKGVNLSDIESIELLFEDNEKGAIFIDSIKIQ